MACDAMFKTRPECDPDRIEEFLDGRLPAGDQLVLESHLEICADCRDRLESTAAGQAYWTEAASHLRDDPLDDECDADSLASAPSAARSPAGERLDVLRIADYFDPTDDPRMLGRFGGYEIVGIIGCGGMGVVLKGYEPALDRYVAIKVLAPHLATSGAARSRFAREARAAAAVLHENVVAIHRVDEAAGLPYLVMPYVPGDSLERRLLDRGPLELAEILRIGLQVAAGLAAAHAQGLVHRDIKPGNILLDKGVERVTITDFGLARAADDASLTRSGVITGTPQYMSPEQARGEPVDGRSDLFSLGSMLYAMCTGRAPFRAETPFGVLRRITESPPRPIRELAPDIPEWLCEIIGRLHAKAPRERFGSATEVADLLGRWLAHVQQPAVIPAPARLTSSDSAGGRFWRSTRRRWIGLAAAIVLAGVALAPRWPGFLPEQQTTDSSAAQVNSDAGTEGRADRDPVPLRPMLDEQKLALSYDRLREQISQIEREWSESPYSGGIDWQAVLLELNQRLHRLAAQLNRDFP